MAEKGNSGFLPSQREKQQITVPFCWEDKPGRPKRDWSLNSAPARPVPSTATTLAASVPFKWEEKPGTPLPQFAEATLVPLCTTLVHTISPSPGGECKDERRGSNPFVDEDDVDDLLELHAEAFPFNTENCESNGYPSENSGKYETWESETTSEMGGDSDSSGSVTRESVEGVSVLEFLFPLSSPEVSFLHEVYREKANAAFHPEPAMTNNSRNQGRRLMVKRGPTLGELILLTRRLSRGRQNPIPKRRKGFTLVRWQEFVRERVHACGLFGTGISQSSTSDAY